METSDRRHAGNGRNEKNKPRMHAVWPKAATKKHEPPSASCIDTEPVINRGNDSFGALSTDSDLKQYFLQKKVD